MAAVGGAAVQCCAQCWDPHGGPGACAERGAGRGGLQQRAGGAAEGVGWVSVESGGSGVTLLLPIAPARRW